MRLFTSVTAAAVLLTPAAIAQDQFLPFGSALNVGTANAVVTVNLGFSFTMPGGQVVTSVDVDTEGRIVEVGSVPSDGSETTAEMISNPTGSINVLWDTQTYTADPNADIYFQTDNSTVAVISWVNVNFTAVCTYQCQLYANGEIVMVYDSRCPADDGIIGVCPGNGAILPAQTNLDDAINVGPLNIADPTVFEDFGFTAGVDAFDFPSSALRFSPVGAGGSTGWVVSGTANVADANPAFALSESTGPVCSTQSRSWLFTPNGTGYDISDAGSMSFDANIGVSAGATADDTITATGLDLGFAFPFPSGLSEQFIQIDPNGRIIPDSASATGDFSPSEADLTGDGYDMICPFWTDFNVTEPHNTGDIFFNTVPGVSATVTWNQVTQFGTDNETGALTTQCTLFPNGSFLVVLEDINQFNLAAGGSQDDALIGASTGNGGMAAEIDLSAIGATVATGDPAYEFWDASGTSPVEPLDLLLEQPSLTALTDPVLGTSFDLQLDALPNSTLGFYLVGFAPANLPLDGFGIPCPLLVDVLTVLPALPTGPGMFGQASIPVPNNPTLVGARVRVQGVANGANNPLGLLATNLITGTLGDL